MRTFLKIWAGQLVSTIGSFMTVFALMIWAWDVTGSATSLALVTFFSQLPRIAVTPLAGIMVDRFPPQTPDDSWGTWWRCSAPWGLAGLYWAGQLQVWHLYGAVAL